MRTPFLPAEYATSLIILANKGFFRSLLNKNHHYQKAKDISYKYPGNYMTKVGILGAGAVGKTVINFLKAKCQYRHLCF